VDSVWAVFFISTACNRLWIRQVESRSSSESARRKCVWDCHFAYIGSHRTKWKFPICRPTFPLWFPFLLYKFLSISYTLLSYRPVLKLAFAVTHVFKNQARLWQCRCYMRKSLCNDSCLFKARSILISTIALLNIYII
jgi:hypothetical protein